MGIFDFFRKKEPAKPRAETATRHCFVLSANAEPGDPARARVAASRVFGDGCSVEVGEGGILTITADDDTGGFLAHVPAPIPNGEAEDNADRNFLWPDGRNAASKHRSHLIVVNSGGQEQTPAQSAIVVSRLALVALEAFDGIGVYWGNASVCNSREAFESFCKDMSEEHLPLPMWLRFQLVRPAKDQLGMYTLGMEQFDLMNLEVDACSMEVGELFEFVSNVAHYLVQSGPVIADGNTVGGSAEERILVRHRPSMIDRNRKVYKIVFER